MKTLLKIILYLLWALLLLLIWFHIVDRVALKIVLTAGLLFLGWLGYALDNAPVMPDNYDEPKYYKK